MPPAESPRYLILGKILRPHGVRGEVDMQVMTDFPERLKSLEKVHLGLSETDTTRLKTYRVEGARPHKGTDYLLRLQGIADRDAADTLRNYFVFVSLDDAVPLEDDEVYLFQVIGLQVETMTGENLGRVVDIIETGANDVYVIQGAAYGEVLIPAVNGVVINIDVEAGMMKVDPPPGLISDE